MRLNIAYYLQFTQALLLFEIGNNLHLLGFTFNMFRQMSIKDKLFVKKVVLCVYGLVDVES